MVRCPLCEGTFTVETINGVSVATCSGCDGIWLAAGDLDRLTGQELEEQLGAWLGEPAECRYCQTPLGFGANCVRCHKPPTVQCPRGHGVMAATLVEIGRHEFEVDRCSSCRGIWLDSHEQTHLDDVEPRQVRKLEIVRAPRGLDRVGQAPRSSYSHGNTFLNNVVQELAFGNRYYGKPEPFSLILFALLGTAAVASFYYCTGGTLAAF